MSEKLAELKKNVYEAARDGKALSLYAMLCDLPTAERREVLISQTEEDCQKTTPFLISTRNGHNKVVQLLLNYFSIEIEQVGTVKFDGYVIGGATALWCAAAAGHLDVVRTLIRNGADVNHTTFSNSTPLRAACFDGRLDIVKYLIEHNADIHIANKYNNTCLMIACYRGHRDVVRYLLEKVADPNATANCGATALHFSSERGHFHITKDLVEFGAKMLSNDQGMTPLHIAAESSHADIVEFFCSCSKVSRMERIEALELLGASFANDKDNYDVDKAYRYMWLAMQERYQYPAGSTPLLKEVKPPVAAYENRIEAQSVAELESIREDPEAIHMEALIVRERILGESNAEIPHPIIFRGAVFADTARFDRCTALWMRALELRQRNGRSIAKDLLRFAQVFSQMLHIGVGIEFDLPKKVFEHNIIELRNDRRKLIDLSEEDRSSQLEVLESNLHTALYLLVILSKLKCSKEEEFQLCKQVYSFNRLKLVVVSTGYTPLHMALDENTLVDDFHVNDVVRFPNAPVANLLVKCGADINAVDIKGNTPLHVIVKYTKPISDFLTLHGIIMLLIEGGAHMDMSNSSGYTPLEVSTTGVADIILRTQGKISLKCIAARAVKKHKLCYKGHVPITLEEFVDIH